jgi:hypothetical protein
MLVSVVNDFAAQAYLVRTESIQNKSIEYPRNSLSSPASLYSSGLVFTVSGHHAFSATKVAWKRIISDS